MEWRRIAATPDNIQAAFNANPFNINNRLALIASLAASSAPQDLERALGLAQEGRVLEGEDGRTDSAIGTVLLQMGRVDEARAQFEAALAKLPTEGTALKARLVFAVNEGRWRDAVEAYDLLATRWMTELPAVADTLSAMLSVKEGRDALAAGLVDNPGARKRLYSLLLARPDMHAALIDMLVGWKSSGTDDMHAEAAQLVAILVQQGRYQEAVLLDRFALSEASDGAGGFVNNGRFADEPTGSPFDWRFPKAAGVSNTRPATQADPALDELVTSIAGTGEPRDGGRGVRIAFLDSPVRMETVAQQMVLPAARYRLDVVARAGSTFVAPDPVRLEVRCGTGRGAVLGRIVLQDLGPSWTRLSTEFEVTGDRDNCGIQTVLVAATVPSSWNNRYRGHLDIGFVRVGGLQ